MFRGGSTREKGGSAVDGSCLHTGACSLGARIAQHTLALLLPETADSPSQRPPGFEQLLLESRAFAFTTSVWCGWFYRWKGLRYTLERKPCLSLPTIHACWCPATIRAITFEAGIQLRTHAGICSLTPIHPAAASVLAVSCVVC